MGPGRQPRAVVPQVPERGAAVASRAFISWHHWSVRARTHTHTHTRGRGPEWPVFSILAGRASGVVSQDLGLPLLLSTF